jgi:4-amino-4-deoxy-L-arabinose transferase-like glycosyltransferase
MTAPRFARRFWPYIAACAVLLIVIAAVRWSLDHPFGIHWDESHYLNQAHLDVYRLRHGMFHKLAERLLRDGAGRPPAYRLLALPLLALFGFHVEAARLVSLACYGMSCWFLYRAVRRIGSPVAATFALMVFALSPDVIAAVMFFGTDAPLYLATSAMMYYLFTCWRDTTAHRKHWIGLGLSLGLGFLSKTSFVLIAIPVLTFWLVVSYFRRLGLPSPWSQWRAGAVAAVIAVPWWVLNIRNAIAYARYARGFVRNSLGPPSLLTWLRWLGTVFEYLLGHGLGILILLIALAYLRQVIANKQGAFEPIENAALGACACAGGPLLLAQISGTNHLLRHISPAVIPLAIVVGILVDKVTWANALAFGTSAGVLMGVQLLMLLMPVVDPNKDVVSLGRGNNGALPWRTLVRFDQWDWSQVRDIADRCGVASPTVAFLGQGRIFNPPSIQAPWLDERRVVPSGIMSVPNVKLLWRYEDGPIKWQELMSLARQSDIVLTAPQYVGEVDNKEDLDNEHNREFLRRLSQESGFDGPIQLEMGRFEPVEIDVFVKRSLGCFVGKRGPS